MGAEPTGLTLPLDRLPDPLPIPVMAGGRAFDATVTPPGSKSLTNRALLLAASASGTSTLRHALTDADDARVMIRALRQLGAGIEIDAGEPTTVRVAGVGGRWRIPAGGEVLLNLHNAGTATRFLSAAALLAPPGTSIVIDGDARMRERPIGELVGALRAVGATVEHLGVEGCPPIRVRPPSPSGRSVGRVEFGRTSSSQFISAMMMVGPFLPGGEGGGLWIRLPDRLTSEPYLHMTVGLMRRLGFGMEGDVAPGAAVRLTLPADSKADEPLAPFDLTIEPDASGATYFLAAAAIVPGARVNIPHLGSESLQGDAAFAHVLQRMGARAVIGADSIFCAGTARLVAADIDLSDMPDTAMTAASVACFAGPTPDNPTATTTLRGLRTLRVKETDRLEALRIELGKIGARVAIFADGDDEGLRITPPPPPPPPSPSLPPPTSVSAAPTNSGTMPSATEPVVFDTYRDHRMAMALALIGLRRAGVLIRDPGCVAKTYPTYWRDLARLYDSA